MNKRGLIKTGVFTFFIALVISVLIISFSTKNASAIIEKNTYFLGDKVKINLQDFQNYTIKINTPSTSFIKKGSNDFFTFNPEEIGEYNLILSYGEITKEFYFEVLANNTEINSSNIKESIKENPPKTFNEQVKPILRESSSKEGNFQSQSYSKRIEFNNKILENRIKINNERVEIDKQVKWTKIINGKTREIKLDIPIQAKNITAYKIINNKIEKSEFKVSNNPIKNTFSRLISLNDNLGDITITLDNENVPMGIEYYTDPAILSEALVSEKEKHVKISSPKGMHYRNVVSHVNLPEEVSKESMVSIFWNEEDEYLDFDLFDMNNNGLYDNIQWDAPHLSDQTFNIVVGNIIEFNFQNSNSYSLGERLKINLRTLGSYELILTSPSNGKISRVGSNDFFIYNLDQIGVYSLELIIGNKKTVYSFNVVDNSIEEIQYFAEIDLPVKWKKVVKENTVEIPISINFTVINKLTGLPVNYVSSVIGNKTIILINEQNFSNMEIEYFTEPPKKEEKVLSYKEKIVEISSPSNLHYENVLAYANIEELTSDKNSIKIFWKEENRFIDFNAIDTDKDGLLDYIEWNVPHLSFQTFQIIVVIKAEHLDENKLFIEDIYDKVKEQDNIWSSPVNNNEYVRIKFERALTNGNDITIFPRIVSGNPRVEVYEFNSSIKIGEFSPINENVYNKLILANLSLEQDIFDLRVVSGSLEFDHIIDPPEDNMVLVFNDTFTDTDGDNLFTQHTPNLGTGWTEIFSSGSDLEINSNQLIGSGAGNDGSAGYAGISQPWVANQMIKATYTVQDTGDDYSYLTVRSDATMANAYVFSFSATAANTYLWRAVSGTEANLNTSCGADNQFTTGDNVTLKVSGTLIQVYDGNNVVCSAVDSNIASGRAGVGIGETPDDNAGDTSAQRLDNVLIYLENTAPVAPLPKINSTNGLNSSSSNLNCYDNVADQNNQSMNVSVRWFKNNALNLTLDYNNSYSNGTLFISSLASGNLSIGQNWSCALRYFDSINYTSWVNSTGNVTIIPLPKPTISIVSPLSQNYTTTIINFNTSLNMAGSWCGLSLNGASNISMTQFNSTYFNYTNSSMSQGSHTVVFACNNTEGNMNSSSGIRYFGVDSIPPQVTIVNPQNITYTSSSIPFNFTLNEAGNCRYTLNSGVFNYTMTANSSNTGFNATNSSIADGSYTIRAYCNDTVGNVNYSTSLIFSKYLVNYTPVIGDPITNQTWTVNQNVIYYLNFSNNGTASNNYMVNFTNTSGASYIALNQSSFNNIAPGSTVFLELNISSSTLNTINITLNVTSINDTTFRDSASFKTTFLQAFQFSSNNITSISVAPFDYDKVIIAWCDDTDDDISLGIFNTSGILQEQIYDVDTTAGSCTANSVGYSVSVSALDSNNFVVSWYDSVDSDITFKILNSSLSNLTDNVDVDSDSGASAAVSASAFNSTAFILGWYDATSSDSTFRTYTSSGTAISVETDADTDSGTTGNSVDVSAINSTAFMFAWFDGGQNDASVITYSVSGTALSSIFDVDGGAGTSESVSISVLNSSLAVLSWVDRGGGTPVNDASFSTITTLSTSISGTQDIDTNVGDTGRPLRVSSLAEDRFVLSWYDSSTDVGVSAQTLLTDLTQLSSETVIQTTTLSFQDVASEEYSTGIQLCENNFVVAISNISTQGFFKPFYSNGTIWSGICPTNVPQILNLTVSSITGLSAIVNWTTDILANSTINYGATQSLGTIQSSNNPVLNRAFTLLGLSSNTLYYYNVTSCFEGRCNTTGTHNFTTTDGDRTPIIGEPVTQQIWSVNTNVRYILNFTNNGTVASDYIVNISNVSGASYATLNQSYFTNIQNGTTIFFEINTSAQTSNVYTISFNVTSVNDSTKYDQSSFITNFYTLSQFSNNSVTSVANAPLDFDKLLVAWCDDTEDDISSAVFNTSGKLLYQPYDVDTSAGACSANGAGHSVDITPLTKNLFVVAWYDSVDDAIRFQMFNSSLSNTTGIVNADTSAGNSYAVSVSAINSTAFVMGWHDETGTGGSSDDTVAVYSSSGSTILSATDVDTNVGGSSQSIEVSAINSTAFAVGWFDDGGNNNDVFFQTYSLSGSAISSAITVDSNGGNSRSVSVAAINESKIVIGWSDINDNLISFQVYLPNGTVSVSTTSVDANPNTGRDTRVSAITQDDFVISWYDDNTDVGTYAQTLIINGTNISQTNTVESNSDQYSDVASELFTTQIQLCENAYIVSFANTTFQAIWEAFYPNGTSWSGICPTSLPSIFNVNVSQITISSAKVNWSTDVESNSTINYGTTPSLGTVLGNNFPKTSHTFNLTGLSGQITYFFNITSCIDGRCNSSGVYNFTTTTVDVTPPLVSLVFPANNSNITDGFSFYFVFNVTDTSAIGNCTLYTDGTPTEFRSSISKDVNETFYHYLSNGQYLWSVSCTDQYGNTNITANRTVNVNYTDISFQRVLYETFTSSFSNNVTAVIRLNNSQDTTQNSVTWNIPPSTLRNIVNASTQIIGANGAVIPYGSVVDFSSSFSASHANVEATWKIYISNSTGITLLCQNGDDGSSGTPLAGTITGQNTTCISSNIRLSPSDRLLYLIDAFNTNGGTTRTITHDWDSPTSSFVAINISTEGFLRVNLSYPTSDPAPSLNSNFNVTCQAYCSIGTCRNTQVYIQRNTSTENWTNINASGNIILSPGETNPHSFGNLSTTLVSSNFSLNGNALSTNNIRCIAVSTYDSANGTSTQVVTVGGAAAAAPVIYLTSPSNATWFNTPNITINYNTTDVNSNIANSTLILNGLRNQTNQSAVNNAGNSSFNLTNLASGTYTWTVNVTDATNLEGTNTSFRTFFIDTQKPSINLSAPQANSSFQVSYVEFNFTAFDNMDTTLSCNLTIDSVVQLSGISSPNGTLINTTISSLSTGTHFWNVTCIDEALNTNTSLTRNFTILDLPPLVSLITSNLSYSTTGNITLIYNATDNNGFSSAQLVLNSNLNMTNQSAVLNGQYNNFSLLNLNEGTYTWTVNVTDSGGLNATNLSVRTFMVDKRAPNISLNLPANNSYSNSSTVNFNFTVIDSIDTILLCNLTAGEKSDLNFAANNGSLTNRQITGFTDGEKIWNVTCFDDAGNFNISQNWVVNITEYPSISLNTANNSFYNSTSFILNYTPSDNTALDYCDLYIDNAFNQTDDTISNGVQNSFTVSGISEGVHTWYTACNDTIQLRNQSQIRSFTVDLDGLNISLIYPQDGANLFVLTLNLSFNATDNIDTTLDCNITVNSIVVNSSTVTSGALTNRSITFATGGTKIWNVTCVDDSSNRITSITRNFSLEQGPSVALGDPINNTFQNISSAIFYYDISDSNDNLANSTLILNGQNNQTNQSALLNDATNNFAITLPDGIYLWTVNVSDLTNLVGTDASFRVLTIDTKQPSIILNYPPNTTTLSTNNITINYTAFDNMDTNLTCNISIDESMVVINIPSYNATEVINYVTRSDGNYLWNVQCIDDSGNLNFSETRDFTVEAPPNVTLQSPQNGNISNINNLTFIYYPSDAIGIFNCSLIIDNAINSSSGTITANANNSFTVNGISEGIHNWTVACTDIFPDFNLFTAQLNNFTIDNTAPNITLITPENNTNQLRAVIFNFTAFDNLDADLNLSCNFYIDNSLNLSSINLTNGSIVSRTVYNHALGAHSWNVSCVDDARNRGWSSKWQYNVTLADLMVNSTSINFNTTSPSENDSVLINATIYNLVNVTVSNITIAFYNGDPRTTGRQIGSNQTIAVLSPLSQTTASIVWSAELGTNIIFVVVDPPYSSNGSIEEWTETNNIANNSITTGAWQFVYGEINSNTKYDLADSQNNSVVRWESVNFDTGNIYVTDSESIVSWATLQAIGKNTTNQNTTNDFSDIDSLLNMTNYTDSVTTLFSNGTSPRNITNYLVFNIYVNNVPIANSTNNTNFYTGILWDMSDNNATNNSQFDITDKEDLIFSTQINKDKTGAYGTYDYEIRIPARLREYRTTQTSSVVFYTEVT